MVMALWISRKQNRHNGGITGQRAAEPLSEADTRNLDENGRSWGSLILAYRHRLRTLALSNPQGIMVHLMA